MIELLRHIRAAWLYGRVFPYVAAADDWTDADGQATRTFFESGTGRKLSMRLRNDAVRAAIAAVQKPLNAEHANGVAAGIGMCTARIDSHFAYETEVEPDNVVNL